MKRITTTIILFFTIALCYGQYSLPKVTIYDTTLANGQRFIISYPVNKTTFYFEDSVDNMDIPTGYISMRHSKIITRLERMRIVDGDTLVRFEDVQLSFADLQNKPDQMFNSNTFRKPIKAVAKEWLKRRLNEE